MIDRMRVDAARGIVERNAREHAGTEIWKQLLQNQRMGRTEIVVILGHHGTETGGGRLQQLVMVIENARHHCRAAMAVQVDGADQKVCDGSIACRADEG